MDYVGLARISFDQANWEEIATLKKTDGSQTDIGNALESLLEVARRDDESQMGVPASDYYGPTVRLCNLISLAVFDALKDSRPTDERDVACIFASNANCYPPGDMLKLRCRPNYLGFFGSRNELVLAIGQPTYSRMVSWPEIGLVGEQKKRTASGRGQLRSYMTASKRYRPDLPTVHGFVVHRGKIQLSQLNVAGIWSSSAAPIGDINSWIALVVLLYQSYEHRDQKLVYDAQQQEFPRWDFTDSTAGADSASQPDPLVLVPFYAAPAPGRATYACYQVSSGPVSHAEAVAAFYTGEVKGFWKTSWHEQGNEDRLNERRLLDRLHNNGWLPGLVRPYPETHGHRLQIPAPDDIIRRAQDAASKRAYQTEPTDATVTDEQTGPAGGADVDGELQERDEDSDVSSGYADDDDEDDVHIAEHEGTDAFLTSMPANAPPVVTRDQEIVHLASIGEPLSQCSTPRELLEAIYDLLQVHIHLWDEGVLHCDVSWFNVLIKPRHYIGNGDKTKPQPCIESVLHGLGTVDDPSKETTEDTFSPTVLLADLDRAIERDRLASNSTCGRDRTGTAMFISCELSDYSEAVYDAISPMRWDHIRKYLTLVDGHDDGSEILYRAFPDDNGQFLGVFNEVAEAESSRRVYARLSARPIHKPRHDAESIYWVLTWAFARARPRGSALETDKKRIANLATFGECLLKHKVGEERSRLGYITSNLLSDLLHPELAPFEDLLLAMASYLAIPWHLYPKVNENHVHIAFRRMILGFLVSSEAPVLKALALTLDTESPRRLDVTKETTTERMTSPRSESQSSVGASGRANVLESMPPLQGPSKGRGPPGAVPGGGASPADVVPCDSASPLSSLPDLAPSTSHGGSFQSGASASSVASKKRKQASAATAEPAKKRSKTAHGVKTPRIHLTTDERARKAKMYDHKLHVDLRSAHGLRLKVWKDRNLWFTKGVEPRLTTRPI